MAERKECPSCAMEVAADSKVCPICSYEFTTTYSPAMRWIAIIVVIAIVLGIIAVI